MDLKYLLPGHPIYLWVCYFVSGSGKKKVLILTLLLLTVMNGKILGGFRKLSCTQIFTLLIAGFGLERFGCRHMAHDISSKRTLLVCSILTSFHLSLQQTIIN